VKISRWRATAFVATALTVASMLTGVAQATIPVGQTSVDSPYDRAITQAEAIKGVTLASNPAVSVDGAGGTITSPAGIHIGITPREAHSQARPQADGLQVLSVLASGSTATFDVSLPDGLKLVQVGNAVEIRDTTGQVTVGQFKNPWALDANNRNLPTHYTVKGSSVVQTIDTRGAAYPVVADPWVTFGWNIYLHLEPWFQKVLLGAGVSGAATAIGALICTPSIVGGPAVAVCVGAVAAVAFALWGVIDHYWSPTRVLVLKFAWCCPAGRFNGWYYG
jgi:hypothetical protein